MVVIQGSLAPGRNTRKKIVASGHYLEGLDRTQARRPLPTDPSLLDRSRNFVRSTPYSDGGPATEAAINIPDLIELDAEGNLYIVEYRHHLIRKLSPVRVAGD
jgi:hypothetical protein